MRVPRRARRTQVLSSLLLCCARLSSAPPHRFVSKSFLIAVSWLTAAHIANIALQVGGAALPSTGRVGGMHSARAHRHLDPKWRPACPWRSQFASYRPLLEALSGDSLGTAFNTRQLTATVVFGALSTLCNVALGVALMCWVDRPDLLQVDNVPAGPV